MGRDYENTHSKILNSAKNLFMKYGYERTNLREICNGAGVTVGAFYNHFEDKESLFAVLVQPCIDGLNQIYNISDEACFSQLSSEQLEDVWQISNNTIIEFVDYIYANFDIFHLLLISSGGTPYHDFVEKLVKVEVNESFRFFDELRSREIYVPQIPQNVIHMLSHCYFSSIFECVVHNYTKEETLKSVDYLVRFFNSGWKKILEFKL